MLNSPNLTSYSAAMTSLEGPVRSYSPTLTSQEGHLQSRVRALDFMIQNLKFDPLGCLMREPWVKAIQVSIFCY